jgi:hypothetical protein
MDSVDQTINQQHLVSLRLSVRELLNIRFERINRPAAVELFVLVTFEILLPCDLPATGRTTDHLLLVRQVLTDKQALTHRTLDLSFCRLRDGQNALTAGVETISHLIKQLLVNDP